MRPSVSRWVCMMNPPGLHARTCLASPARGQKSLGPRTRVTSCRLVAANRAWRINGAGPIVRVITTSSSFAVSLSLTIECRASYSSLPETMVMMNKTNQQQWQLLLTTPGRPAYVCVSAARSASILYIHWINSCHIAFAHPFPSRLKTLEHKSSDSLTMRI